VLTKGSPWSLCLRGTLCPPVGPSLMVKPAGQKRWMAAGAQLWPGGASRGLLQPLSGPHKALPPAAPVRTSPSSRSVQSKPGVVGEQEPHSWGFLVCLVWEAGNRLWMLWEQEAVTAGGTSHDNYY
jgi:hypothetical protein